MANRVSSSDGTESNSMESTYIANYCIEKCDTSWLEFRTLLGVACFAQSDHLYSTGNHCQFWNISTTKFQFSHTIFASVSSFVNTTHIEAFSSWKFNSHYPH